MTGRESMKYESNMSASSLVMVSAKSQQSLILQTPKRIDGKRNMLTPTSATIIEKQTNPNKNQAKAKP